MDDWFDILGYYPCFGCVFTLNISDHALSILGHKTSRAIVLGGCVDSEDNLDD